MSDKTYLLPLEKDEAAMLWWAIYEKRVQLNTRIAQFKHVNWPLEAINAAKWEVTKLGVIQAKLDELGQDSTT